MTSTNLEPPTPGPVAGNDSTGRLRDGLLRRAAAHFCDDQYPQCAKLATRALQIDPTCAAAFCLRAHAVVDQNPLQALLDSSETHRLLSLGHSLPDFIGDDAVGIARVALDSSAQLYTASSEPERVNWQNVVLEWAGKIARTAPGTFELVLLDSRLIHLHPHLQLLRDAGRQSHLAVEAR